MNEDLIIEMVDDFLKPFGCDSDLDSDFFYSTEEERVYFSILSSERSDRLFKEYILSHFNYKVSNIFIISLLHEVGHHFTYSFFTRAEKRKAQMEKYRISAELAKNDTDEVYSSYFDISIEKVATEWAINYYKENKKRCDDFYFQFQKTLFEEYLKAGLTIPF